jgi:sulfite exporter TauE/SafE
MMAMEAGLLAALIGGLVGSVHCLGMCGGIAGALGMAGGGRASMAVSYSAGRIASYSAAGAIAGAIGAGLAGAAGLGPWLRLLMGLVLLLLGLQVALNLKLLAPLEAAGAGLWKRLAPLARRFVPPRHAGQALALGALWGWLPCGLVYGMLAAAAGAGSAAQGALFMAVFGLGTAPAMIGVTWASGRSGSFLNARRRRLLGWLLVIFGAWTMATPLMKLSGSGDHGGHMPATGQQEHRHHDAALQGPPSSLPGAAALPATSTAAGAPASPLPPPATTG